MSSTLKKTLLAGAAGMAMATGFAVSSANAFDQSYWKFYLTIDPCVDIDVNLDPDSMTTVEIEQKSIGDITAISVVKDVYVAAASSHHWYHSPAIDALTQLGEVVSTATAVANNANIEAKTEAVFIDSKQFAAGGYHGGEVLAKSIVLDIDNLTVDSAATAVGNNFNMAVDMGEILANTAVVANLAQTSYMDVTAKSIVKDVTLSNFKNLGSLTRPVVSSVATAVGNNINVTVAPPAP